LIFPWLKIKVKAGFSRKCYLFHSHCFTIGETVGYALEGNIGNAWASGSAIAGSTPAYCLFTAGSGEHLFATN
jgi:hypothetical protein